MQGPLELCDLEQAIQSWDPQLLENFQFGNEEDESSIYVDVELGNLICKPFPTILLRSMKLPSYFFEQSEKCIILKTVFIPENSRRKGFASSIVSMLEAKSRHACVRFAVCPITSEEMEDLILKRQCYQQIAPFGRLLVK